MTKKSILIPSVTRLCHLIYTGLSHVLPCKAKHSQGPDLKSFAPKYVSGFFLDVYLELEFLCMLGKGFIFSKDTYDWDFLTFLKLIAGIRWRKVIQS